MKRQKIKLNNIKAPDKNSTRTIDKKYQVYLYWGSRKVFTSKKQALSFLAKTSRFLNDKFNDLNFILADAYTCWRLLWPYLHGTKLNTSFNQDFQSISEVMDRWCNNFGMQGNFNAFNKLETSIGKLESIVQTMASYEKAKIVNAGQMKSILNRIEVLKKEVASYLNENT